MVRQTKPLSGGGKDKFLRGLVDSVDGLPDSARQALTRELSQGITEVRVRREAYERVRDRPDRPPEKAVPLAPRTEPPNRVAPTAASFDPFAFSVVAVLTKKGKAALMAELDKVAAVDELRGIADAQHLALDPALDGAAEIRTAIVSGAERRIAERKAAAS